ncbi:5-deoxy-glucuronate isomerase [Actinomyces bovis]|uniref:5-deoxy-glucuronate isomerase n=1 Tax=Actinomyces bovis TaxID=1658 RepID=A0ABY1VMC6_9ACTO|nr:5-deoxy-glucuronate isomerase [Actinomyces bovis]SPT52836.1 5-deoxy-glucuronate isomerase [Actinomyces bovis]VEG54910.1 5-deoxy-glucuronate isomerase [Actinomyces israelii]
MTLPSHVRAGSTGHDSLTVDITPEQAGWSYSGLRVAVLAPGQTLTLESGEAELLVLPLAGACTVEVGGQAYELAGRESVFKQITDYLYVPRASTFTITSAAGGRFALPSAVAEADLPVRYFPREQVGVSIRGAGDCSRQVNNYALNNDVLTSHLLVTEVLTPGGNWSSYPAHKHEQKTETERELEEIYYFEIASSPEGGPGFGLHRTYASNPEQPIDVCVEVRDGDVALVPYGYHGPCVAAPGYDMYYLNVMAGPETDLVWLAPDDPAHHWLRASWESQETDPRLPMAH